MRTAVITGAAGGIGVALCRAFRADGYRTIGIDLEVPCRESDESLAIDLDRYCRDAAARDDANAQLAKVVGIHAVSVLINNAAVQVVAPSADLGSDAWHRTLNVNVVAPFLLAQALLEKLRAARGSIINIASIHAMQTKPGFVCYATSKAALVGLTRSMAVDLGAQVRVNAICPAAVATPMLEAGFSERPEAMQALAACHPVGRIARPEEVADAALYLASDRAGFFNGSILGLDGGIAARLHDPL